jgi:hypothetical protein
MHGLRTVAIGLAPLLSACGAEDELGNYKSDERLVRATPMSRKDQRPKPPGFFLGAQENG